MKRTTIYKVIVYDITSTGNYDNPRGDSYDTWEDALNAYRYEKRHDSDNTLVELEKEVWDADDNVESLVIYAKEIR